MFGIFYSAHAHAYTLLDGDGRSAPTAEDTLKQLGLDVVSGLEFSIDGKQNMSVKIAVRRSETRTPFTTENIAMWPQMLLKVTSNIIKESVHEISFK